MNTKTLLLCIVSATGCGSVVDSRAIGDAGAPSSDAGSDAGSDQPPPPPGSLYGKVYDERNDTIDFSSGVPVHTHTGAMVDLSTGSSTGCPDVYKYAYLMDDHAPVYGSEQLPDPLTFHIDAPSAVSAMYRVRSETATVRDWTPMTAGSGSYAIALHRNDTEQMRALGTQVGTFYIDAKIVDANGETTKTACWQNHPMAAPLDVQPVQPGYVFGMTFAKHSLMDPMMNGQSFSDDQLGAELVYFSFRQETSEPVSLTAKLAALPTATGTKQIVSEFIAGSSTVVSELCGTASCAVVTAPQYTTSTQPLVGAWELQLYDDGFIPLVQQQPGSDVVSYLIPGRAAGQPAKAYGVYLLLANANAVAPDVANPAWNTFASHTVNDHWVVGQFAAVSTSFCSQETTKAGASATTLHYCVQRTNYQHVAAVNQATLAFGAISFALTAGVGDDSTKLPPAYVPASTLTFGPRTWDAGVAGL